MAKAASDRPQGFWAVFDKNANQLDDDGNTKPRMHEPVPGHRYKLSFDTPTYMQEGHARAFLKDEAFIVQDANGKEVLPLKLAARQREIPKRLAPNFVIADLTELHIDALVTRAAQLPGGDRFTSDSDRVHVQRFLEAAQEAQDRANSADDDAPLGSNRGAMPVGRDADDAGDIDDGKVSMDEVRRAMATA